MKDFSMEGEFMNVGDIVRVVQIPSDLISPSPKDQELADIFRACLGFVGPIQDVRDYDGLWLYELKVGAVFGEEPYMHSIWIEPEYVEAAPPPVSP